VIWPIIVLCDSCDNYNKVKKPIKFKVHLKNYPLGTQFRMKHFNYNIIELLGAKLHETKLCFVKILLMMMMMMMMINVH
jgi:hypothetical protein